MLNERIKQARIEKNMTQAQLARVLGISQPAIWKIENNETELTVNRLFAIAEALGVDAEALIARDDLIPA